MSKYKRGMNWPTSLFCFPLFILVRIDGSFHVCSHFTFHFSIFSKCTFSISLHFKTNNFFIIRGTDSTHYDVKNYFSPFRCHLAPENSFDTCMSSLHMRMVLLDTCMILPSSFVFLHNFRFFILPFFSSREFSP